MQLLLHHGADACVVAEPLCRIPLRTVDIATARGFREVVTIIDKAIEARQSLALLRARYGVPYATATWRASSES